MDSQASELQKITRRLEQLLGKKIAACQSARGGYTSAHRLIVQCTDGSRFFAKIATDDTTAGWLRTEHSVYESLHGNFMAKVIAFDDEPIWLDIDATANDALSGGGAGGESGVPILILEDLSHGSWNAPWSTDSVSRVLKALAVLHNSPCPKALPTLESMRSELVSWHLVASEPEPFLSLGLCSSSWLQQSLPQLIAAENAAILDGKQLLHLDIRSDNICFLKERVVLVDWNWACVGNAKADVIAWLPSMHAEGGPRPEDIVSGEAPLIALFAGFWAQRAGLPPPNPGSSVRQIQLKQLKVALPWCAQALGLPSTDSDC